MRLTFIRRTQAPRIADFAVKLEEFRDSFEVVMAQIESAKALEAEEMECIRSRFTPMLRLLDFRNEQLAGKWSWAQVLRYRRCRIECLYHYFQAIKVDLERCRVIRLRTMPIDAIRREKLEQQILVGKMCVGVLLYLCSAQLGIDLVDDAVNQLLSMATINVGPQLVRART